MSLNTNHLCLSNSSNDVDDHHNIIPPYRVHFDSAKQTHTLSSIFPSPSNIRLVQHLCDISFPLRYTSKFYDSLAVPQSKTWFKGQVLVLTSSNDSNMTDKISTAGTISTPRLANIHIHKSLIDPLPLNPLATEHSAHYNVNGTEDNNEINVTIAKHYPQQSSYMKEFTNVLRLPEYVADHHDKQVGALDSLDENTTNSGFTQYIHTSAPSNALNTDLDHQIVGAYVLRPSTESLTSFIPDMVHVAAKTIPSVVSSIYSFFGGADESPEPTLPSLNPPISASSIEPYHPQLARTCYLCLLSIAPQFLSSGLGSLLLFNCIEFAISNYGAWYLYLHVLESNKRAVDLYKRFGFVVESKLKNYFQFPDHLIGKPIIADDATIENGTIVTQSFILPKDESGDALYMYLDLSLWQGDIKLKIEEWLQTKLGFTRTAKTDHSHCDVHQSTILTSESPLSHADLNCSEIAQPELDSTRHPPIISSTAEITAKEDNHNAVVDEDDQYANLQ